MRTFYKLIFIANFLFWGGGSLYCILFIIAYNGVIPIFSYKEATSFTINSDMSNLPEKLVYTYTVDSKEYQGYQDVSTETAEDFEKLNLKILYNTTFKNLSMVEGLGGRESKPWDYTVGLIIFGSFFLFTLIIWKFANHDKWISIYSGTYVKPERKKK